MKFSRTLSLFTPALALATDLEARQADGYFPQDCDIRRLPITDDQRTALEVIFTENVPGMQSSTYADWLINYATTLINQINEVQSLALPATDLYYTFAFTLLDIPAVLGMASAAPMYTCYLSSLWSSALSSPGNNAKAVPTSEDNQKLIVLFETHRESDGDIFNYAGILVDEVQDMMNEARMIASYAPTDPNYTVLFDDLEAHEFLDFAYQAPIYRQGLSQAIASRLSGIPADSGTSVVSMSAPSVVTLDDGYTGAETTITILGGEDVSTSTSESRESTVVVTTTASPSSSSTTPRDTTITVTKSSSSSSRPSETTITVVKSSSTEAKDTTVTVTRNPETEAKDTTVTVTHNPETEAKDTTTTVIRTASQAPKDTTTSVTITRAFTGTIEVQTVNGGAKAVAGAGALAMGIAGLLL